MASNEALAAKTAAAQERILEVVRLHGSTQQAKLADEQGDLAVQSALPTYIKNGDSNTLLDSRIAFHITHMDELLALLAGVVEHQGARIDELKRGERGPKKRGRPPKTPTNGEE